MNTRRSAIRVVESLMLLFLIGIATCLSARPAFAKSKYRSAIQRSKFVQSSYGNTSHTEKLFRRYGKRKKSRLLWKLGLEGESLSSAVNLQSHTVGFGAHINYRMALLDTLSLRVKGKILMQAGRTQDLFGDLEPDSGAYAKEALVNWEAWKNHIAIKGGIINQGFLKNPLLVKSLGFPGMRQDLRWAGRSWDLGFVAQQLIPTSSTLSTRVQEKENTPKFFTETLSGTLKLSSTNWLRARYSLFRYEDLPSTVAFSSQIGGNTYQGGDIRNAEFKYDFKGWMSQLTFEQKLTNSVAVQFNGDFLRNQSAVDRYNESRRLSLSVAVDIGRWLIKTTGESFFVEPDAVPSFYNDFLRGHNNRQGWGAHIEAESKRHNFKVGLGFYDAQLLNKTATFAREFQQDDLKTLFLTLETAYAGI